MPNTANSYVVIITVDMLLIFRKSHPSLSRGATMFSFLNFKIKRESFAVRTFPFPPRVGTRRCERDRAICFVCVVDNLAFLVSGLA